MTENLKSNELLCYGIHGFYQKWTEKRSFSYLESPRPDHGLIYICCEYAVFEEENARKRKFARGSVLYLPKGAKYRASFFGTGREYDSLLINFMTLGADFPFSDITELTGNAAPDIVKHFREIAELYKSRSRPAIPVNASFYSLLDKLIPEGINDDAVYGEITAAVRYINTHLSENPSVPNLGKLCLLSESGFRKKFIEKTQKTPHGYILDLKLERAAKMLESPEISIFDISEALGFFDAAHFSRSFSGRFGKSPSEYRKEICK